MIFKKKKEKKKSFLDKIKKLFIVEEEESTPNKVVPSKKVFTKFEMFFFCFITLIGGLVLGCFLTMYTGFVYGGRIDGYASEFLSTYNYVKDNYYDEVDEKKLIDSAISGMLNSLGDEHSYYMDEESTSSFNTSVDGKYVGVGITIRYEEDKTTIIDMFKNSPAEKAGLKVDDVIIKVNGKDVTKENSSKIAELISGEIGKKVTITVLRGEEKLEFKTTLAEIEIESVETELKEVDGKKIGYIRIDNFASNTYKQFNSKLTKLEKNNIDSLIIDVRGNTGGHLSQVTEILDMFFDKKTVLYQIETKGKKVKYRAKTSDKREYPVAILVNHASASASEVLTACFMDNYKDVTVVGTTTYGKGTVQKAYNLSSGASYKFTTQKWLTPKGKWINKKGITPTIVVELPEEETLEDVQLNEAINQLKIKES